MANQASMNLLMNSFGMFGNAVAQQREYGMQRKKQQLLEQKFQLEQEQAAAQQSSLQKVFGIMGGMGGEPQAGLQGPVPDSGATLDTVPQELSDDEITQRMMAAGQELVKAGHVEYGMGLIGKAMPKSSSEREMEALKQQYERLKVQREGIGAQTDLTKLQFLPDRERTGIESTQTGTQQRLQNMAQDAGMYPSRLNALELENERKRIMTPLDAQQAQVDIAKGTQAYNQSAERFPVEMAQQGLNVAESQQRLGQNAVRFPAEMEALGVKTAQGRQDLSQGAGSFALDQALKAANVNKAVQGYEEDTATAPYRIESARLGTEQKATDLAVSQKTADARIQQEQLEVKKMLQAHIKGELDIDQAQALLDRVPEEFKSLVLNNNYKALANQRERYEIELKKNKVSRIPEENEAARVDLEMKRADLLNRRLQQDRNKIEIGQMIEEQGQGKQLYDNLVTRLQADPKNKQLEAAVLLAKVGKYGDAIESAFPKATDQDTPFKAMLEKYGDPDKALAAIEKSKSKATSYGTEREAMVLEMFKDKGKTSYGELTSDEMEQVNEALWQKQIEKEKAGVAAEPMPAGIATKVAGLNAVVRTANEINLDAVDAYAGMKKGLVAGAKEKYTGSKYMPDDEVALRAKLADMADYVGRLRSGAAIRADEEKALLRFIPKMTDDPKAFRQKLQAFSDNVAILRDDTLRFGTATAEDAANLLTPVGQFTQPAGAPAAAPAQTPQAPNIIGRTPEGRPMVKNEDGSVSTERTITIQHPKINGGKPTNIPSMYDGIQRSEEQAVNIIIESGGKDPETGRTLQGYNSIDEAVKAAQERSEGLPTQTQQGQPPAYQGLDPNDATELDNMLTPEQKKYLVR